jgi:beta-lactamase regulating signal transducer with metallopeptidase domain
MQPASDLLPFIAAGVRAANGVAEWLMTYAIHSTLLIGGLLLITATARGRRVVAAHGSWLWRFALVGAVVSASLQSVRSSSPLGGTLRVDKDTPAIMSVRVEMTSDQAMAAPPASSGSRTVRWQPKDGARMVMASSININPRWPILALGAWLVLAAGVVAWFFAARGRFLRSIGPRRPANHTLAANALRHLCRESGFARPVTLTLSDRLTSPVALGGGEICLPSRALAELDPIRLESILAHELAHLVRRDPSWLTFARVIEAVFFFQPLNVLARRRMQESAEFASDAWASTRVARPLDLAHCLARVAEWTIAAPRLPVPAMAERRGAVLVRRVERLTRGSVIPETTPGRRARLAAVGALVALVFLAPRAAVGAERGASGAGAGRVPAAGGLMIVRRTHSGDSAAAPFGGEVREIRLVVDSTGSTRPGRLQVDRDVRMTFVARPN